MEWRSRIIPLGDHQLKYRHLEKRPDKNSQELFVVNSGISASTIWHDRYVSRLTPVQIAEDRDILLEAVYEALTYCLENWEMICHEKDQQRLRLEEAAFFSGTKTPQ